MSVVYQMVSNNTSTDCHVQLCLNIPHEWCGLDTICLYVAKQFLIACPCACLYVAKQFLVAYPCFLISFVFWPYIYRMRHADANEAGKLRTSNWFLALLVIGIWIRPGNLWSKAWKCYGWRDPDFDIFPGIAVMWPLWGLSISFMYLSSRCAFMAPFTSVSVHTYRHPKDSYHSCLHRQLKDFGTLPHSLVSSKLLRIEVVEPFGNLVRYPSQDLPTAGPISFLQLVLASSTDRHLAVQEDRLLPERLRYHEQNCADVCILPSESLFWLENVNMLIMRFKSCLFSTWVWFS